MQKNYFMAMVCMVALSACTKEVKLRPESATLYAGDSIQVTVENAGATPRLVSEDVFVASVSETGWLKARHVGETTVRCDYDASSTTAELAQCKVTVQPRYEYYTEPISDWTTTRAQLIEQLGEPSIDNGEMLVFGNPNKDDFIYLYYLAEGKIIQSNIVHKSLTVDEAEAFLSERYAAMEDEPRSYMDADDEDGATKYVYVQQGTMNPMGMVVMVTYSMAGEE